MFEQTFVATGKTSKTWTVFVSFLAQSTGVVVLVVLPMIYFDALPKSTLTSFLVAPSPPPPPPPPPPPEAPKVVKVIPRQFDEGILMAPKEVPKTIAVIKEDELPPSAAAGVRSGLDGGVAIAVLNGILGPVGAAPPPPPPPVKKDVQAAGSQHIRVGGNVQGAKLVRQPKPVYPPLARQARIQGIVKLHALISKEGTIEDLKVISGHPLLAPAALDSVKQWVYQPTLLNGEPVGVDTEIDVNFTLSQ
jgi:protein TonB